VLLDVRGPGEYQDGAIPGTVNIPLPQLAVRLAEIPLASTVLVNCQGGWRSGVATSFLNAHGFTAVDLRGGYQAWSSVVPA
jgi:hydroxyacylglutathione hydrolase